MSFKSLPQPSAWTRDDLARMLLATDEQERLLYRHASLAKHDRVGNTVYLRGLIEYSNICSKNCLYCGIRCDNDRTHRYTLTDDEVLQAVRFAHRNGLGSVAIQSGEDSSEAFTGRVDSLLRQAMRITNGEIGITLSCGEQTAETYRRWFESGAARYLLRIETSSPSLYGKIHPRNSTHRFARRLEALENLKQCGYQVGTGVMIGLPFQTVEDLAGDLLFMKQSDIDMCGMGPYIEHAATPLYMHKETLLPLKQRLHLSFKMIALLRMLMPDINIAATTALQTIEEDARERAVQLGANVIMPNITPKHYRDDYFLYQNKPVSANNESDDIRLLTQRIEDIGHHIGFFRQGNSIHYKKRTP